MKEINAQNNLLPPSGIGQPKPAPSLSSPKESSFGKMLQNAFEKINQLQTEADKSIQTVASGNRVDIHQTMIAMEKADVSFKLMMEVRNKVVSAYETISRMQI